MYQMFASKDHLLAASLQQRAADYAEQLLPDEVNAGSARENILHVFDQLTVLASRRDYHGCPYLAAQVEIKDTRNPAFSIAAGFAWALKTSGRLRLCVRCVRRNPFATSTP